MKKHTLIVSMAVGLCFFISSCDKPSSNAHRTTSSDENTSVTVIDSGIVENQVTPTTTNSHPSSAKEVDPKKKNLSNNVEKKGDIVTSSHSTIKKETVPANQKKVKPAVKQANPQNEVRNSEVSNYVEGDVGTGAGIAEGGDEIGVDTMQLIR